VGDLRDEQLASRRVDASLVRAQRVEPRRSDRDVRVAKSPRPSKGVGDDHCNGCPATLFDGGADPCRRRVGVLGEQGRTTLRHVGHVNAGVRTDQSVVGLDDEVVLCLADHAARLAQGCGAPFLARVGLHHPSLGLGNDLLRDHDDVAGDDRRALRLGRIAQERSDVGAGLDLVQPHDSDDAELSHRGHDRARLSPRAPPLPGRT